MRQSARNSIESFVEHVQSKNILPIYGTLVVLVRSRVGIILAFRERAMYSSDLYKNGISEIWIKHELPGISHNTFIYYCFAWRRPLLLLLFIWAVFVGVYFFLVNLFVMIWAAAARRQLDQARAVRVCVFLLLVFLRVYFPNSYRQFIG